MFALASRLADRRLTTSWGRRVRNRPVCPVCRADACGLSVKDPQYVET